jgi:hypothetical protein
MEKFWKIKNLTDTQVKITVCVKPNTAPGIILKPNQFCIGKQQMTAPLDKQSKTKKVSIEEFDNSYFLELGKAYDESFLDKAKEKTNKYAKR